MFGHAESLMVNSGSSANLVMLAALRRHYDWPAGSEVIVSAVGFPTTVAPIIQNRMTPVFCDIEWETLNFSLDAVEAAVTERTVAVFLSPVLGDPCDVTRLSELCKRTGITLILDGCDSLGSEWLGLPLPSYAAASSCSFYPAHHISTGEGGMVSSSVPGVVEKARVFAHWGRDCHCVGAANALPKGSCGKRFAEWLGPEQGIVDHKYLFTEQGYNLKPLDLQGAIGLKQLEKFPSIFANRRYIKQRLADSLRNQDRVRVPGELPGARTNWFGVPLVCDSVETKQRLVTHLESAKIQTRNYFAGNLLLHPGYSYLGEAADFPNANEVLRRVFFLGCNPTYSEAVISYIEEQLQKGLQ